jgi:hypothetical protein
MGGRWTYELRHIKCGKPKCRCANGAAHRPYWYGFRHRNGEMESKYLGKRDPHLAGRRVDASLIARRSNELKDYTSALRTFSLLNLDEPPSALQVKQRYEYLKTKHRDMKRINAAYEVLRRRHGGAGS